MKVESLEHLIMLKAVVGMFSKFKITYFPSIFKKKIQV